ncbi:MAG: phosphodiester glycosidase family protein [Aristaeellaceae bacterium]
MKRSLIRAVCLLLILSLMPMGALAETSGQAAREYAAVLLDGRAEVDAALLSDGQDDTAYGFRRGQAGVLTVTLPEDAQAQQLYIRMAAAPATVTLKQKNEAGKYAVIAQVSNPALSFVMTLDAPVAGDMQLEIAGVNNAAVSLRELRFFGAGALPEDVKAFRTGAASDILYVVPSPEDAEMDQVAAWTAAGRTVQCLFLTPAEDAPALTDQLWAAGTDRYPIFGTLKAVAADATETQVSKTWPAATLKKLLVSGVRASQPSLVLYGGSGAAGDALAAALPDALTSAPDYTFEMSDAAANGLWVVEKLAAAGSREADAALADWETADASLLRQYCVDAFADAQHGSSDDIPYPDNRLEDGYLPEGEFLYEDAEQGLWAYVSGTLQVEIIRWEQPEIPRVWFVSDIRFKPEAESIHPQAYINATFPGQMIYPETLAQTAQLVFGINGDYYIYREDKHATGNIIRNRQVLYNHTKTMSFPNMDTMALRDDGSMSVYDVQEITADELLAQGDVHDALSFGPWLVRDGRLRVWDGKNSEAVEPRNAIGMVEPGHYKVITVEGRFNKGVGPAGVTLNMLAQMLYAQGVQQGFNLDGGNTAVLIFMGKKLNRTASKSGNGETQPRNMSELFGIGSSGRVHTDKLDVH